ncbi:hypothetical protein Plim_3125 [Planctopirus limnophila DSM 3776]|uniref:Uncharacterized protein n=1 Tax=Planctopirus limnophila (strain ATCC 43296 / DSM 3776 / IFAM 1008 / Mu 290) TaxID=521674 RepID=D5SSY9_PLAL2|nr:hypothetical protein [Planctopirus limnophila]ADG68940.1 hypothetical protein Plim_3125 [Planctopirus limnophila DSM 3776]
MTFPVTMNWNLAGGVWIVLAMVGILVFPEARRWPFSLLAWLAGVVSQGAQGWPGVWSQAAMPHPLTKGILICLTAGSGLVLGASALSYWFKATDTDEIDAWDWWLLLTMGLGVVMLSAPHLAGALLAWELIQLTSLKFIRCEAAEDQSRRVAIQSRLKGMLMLWQGTTAVFVWTGWLLLMNQQESRLTSMSNPVAGWQGESWGQVGWVLMVAGCAGRLCLIPGHFLWLDLAAMLSPCRLSPNVGETARRSLHGVLSGHQLVRWLCGLWVLSWLAPRNTPGIAADALPVSMEALAWSLIGGWTALAAGLMILKQEEWSRWVATILMAGTGWWVWSLCLLEQVPVEAQVERWEGMSRQLTVLVLGYGLMVWGVGEAFRTGRRLQYVEEWEGLFSVCPSGVLAVTGGVCLFLLSSPWPGWLIDTQPLLSLWQVSIGPDDRVELGSLSLLPGAILVLTSSLLVWVGFFRWLVLVFTGLPIGARSVPWSSLGVVILVSAALMWLAMGSRFMA